MRLTPTGSLQRAAKSSGDDESAADFAQPRVRISQAACIPREARNLVTMPPRVKPN